MTLLKRILVEKRSLVVSLVIAIIVNIGAYGLVVRPLEQKTLGASDRAAAAAAALRAAERDHAEATSLVTGKTLADQELSTFFDKVVPADLPAARRMTYASLPALARRSNVKYQQRHTDVEPPQKNARLGHLQIGMVLQGDYESVRRFIYALETAPDFVIIDDVSLIQSEPGKPLTLTLMLSTYFRLPNGN
jgi:type II secretion system (T2SS) protein M